MDPSQYPSPNNVDDDMPMFGGGGGGARWPGHEDYRVETPGSVGSTIVSDSEFDPFFGTKEVEEMEPSCGQHHVPARPPPKKGKKKMARKEKAPSVPVTLPPNEPNETTSWMST